MTPDPFTAVLFVCTVAAVLVAVVAVVVIRDEFARRRRYAKLKAKHGDPKHWNRRRTE